MVQQQIRHLPSQLTERNLTETCHMFGSECNLKMHVQNLGKFPPSKSTGPKTTNLRDLTATLTAYIFGEQRRKLQRFAYITRT